MPLDLNTELAMRLISPEVIKIDLFRNSTINSVGVKEIIIPTGYERHFVFVGLITYISTIIAFAVIF